MQNDPRGYYGATGGFTLWLSSNACIIYIHLVLGASVILFLSSLPRVAKGPVPAALTVLSAATGAYYLQSVRALRAKQ